MLSTKHQTAKFSYEVFESYKDEKRDEFKFVDFLNLSQSEILESLHKLTEVLDSHEIFERHKKAILFDIIDHLSDLYLNSVDKSLVVYMRKKVKYEHDADANEQYRNFVNSLRSDSAKNELFGILPVLEGRIKSTIENWERHNLNILNRLKSDFRILQETFSDKRGNTNLLTIKSGLSDPHRRQQSVAHILFDDFEVIYKPRNAAVEHQFQNFLKWINGHMDDLKFRPMLIIEGDDYSWFEFVKARPCQALGEIDTFYERTGGYMALFYFFGCTDLHYENVIASGADPMFIDLETLFQPSLEKNSLSEDDTNRRVGTVMRSGLLPKRLWGDESQEGTDVGGISGTGGEQSASKAKIWENPGTIFAKESRAYVQMPKTKNVPTFDGKYVEIWRYEKAVEWGFRRVYDFMRHHYEEFVAEGGLFESFMRCPVRVLLRNTSTYETLRRESSHPSLLKSPEELTKYLNWIRKDNKGFPAIQAVVDYEIRSIQSGDIPMFYSMPASGEIVDGDGNVYQGLVSLNAETICRWRVGKKLHASDLDRQLNYVKMSFEILKPDFSVHRFDSEESSLQNKSPSELHAIASSGFDDIGKFAGTDFGICVPMRLGHAPGKGHFIGFLEVFDYHKGLPGSTLACAYLGQFLDRKWPDSLDHYVDYFLGRLKKEQDQVNSLGATQGHGGIIYSLAHIFHISGRNDVKEELDYHLQIVADLIEFSKDVSVANGLSGALVGLASYFHVTQDAFAATLIRNLLEKISSFPLESTVTVNQDDWQNFLLGQSGVNYALALALAVLEGKEAPKANGPDLRKRERVFEFGLNGGADGFAFAALRKLSNARVPDINVFELPRAFA